MRGCLVGAAGAVDPQHALRTQYSKRIEPLGRNVHSAVPRRSSDKVHVLSFNKRAKFVSDVIVTGAHGSILMKMSAGRGEVCLLVGG